MNHNQNWRDRIMREHDEATKGLADLYVFWLVFFITVIAYLLGDPT